MDHTVLSWGRSHKYDHSCEHLERFTPIEQHSFIQNQDTQITFHGKGRSYGDVCLNEGKRLILTAGKDNLISFDRSSGRLNAYSGITLAQLHQITIPAGWVVRVSPGTKFVTLGGAVANDVHGKNHHLEGSFGSCVRSLILVRSNGERMKCSRSENSDMFALTLSGLGLTGYIESVELQLKQIRSSHMEVENIPYDRLETFYELSAESVDWPYTVAWLDCFSPPKKLGRGIFTRARFCTEGALVAAESSKKLTMPIDLPSFALNRVSISAFNLLYRNRPGATYKGTQLYDPFFYPLDTIHNWNRMYGRQGFFQHQSIIPMESRVEGITALLNAIRKKGQGSFLAVLKVHGSEKSPGLNSFPFEGVSLALDFVNRGKKTISFLHKLDDIVLSYGGRMYPAKDALMKPETYQTGYPNWKRLEEARDPSISSSFWRRVTNNKDQ